MAHGFERALCDDRRRHIERLLRCRGLSTWRREFPEPTLVRLVDVLPSMNGSALR